MREGGAAAKGRTLRLGRLAGRHAAAVRPQCVLPSLTTSASASMADALLYSSPYNSILREEMSKVGIEYYDASHCKVIVYCSSLFTQRTIACAFWPPQTWSQGG